VLGPHHGIPHGEGATGGEHLGRVTVHAGEGESPGEVRAAVIEMADRVVLMRGGKVEQDGAPADLYTTPATSFAARFIGTPPMNLMALANSPDGAVVRGTRGPALFRGRGAGLIVGIRPEALHLTAEHGLEAQIVATEYLGADTILTCKLGDEMLSLRAGGQLAHAPGETVRIAADPVALHLFDAQSGRRLGGTASAPA